MIRRPPDHSSKFARGELADEAEAERLEAVAPDATLRRREFLARTAMLAGAAGMAGVVPAETLIAEAAKRRRRRFPSPQNLPIDTFVVLMMENRSFDHYFGWHPDADAKNEGLSYPEPGGGTVDTYRLTPDFQGCGHPDPDHGWTGGRYQWNRGRNDGFVFGNEAGTGSDEFAAGYYLKEDLGFIPHIADAFTLYDRWFCSLMASTYPNRHYQWGAQNGGQKSNMFPPEVPGQETGFTWETIMDRAEANGVSFTYYNSDLPFAGLYGQRGLAQTQPVSTFYEQAATGTLPNISFVDPPFRDGGGGDGLSADEHPHGDIRLGQAFMSDVTHAFMESPQYERGAMFIDYDEWGGFFDHVPPPFVPDDRRNLDDINEDWGFTGFRVPGVAVSPFARGGRVSHMTVTHESILKLISYKFGFGYLNKRHRYASNIGRSFDFRNPDLEPPAGIPDPTAILATPCSLQGNGAGEQARAKPHDMVALETSGYLERLGFEVPDASVDQIFREPSSVKQAYEESKAK